MYSFRKDFGDRRDEAVKEITGYEELIAFFKRSINFSQHSKHPSVFIGQCEVTLAITQKEDERLKANWKGHHENGETVSHTEDFSYDCEAEKFAKIIIYILRKDNIDFKIVKNSITSDENTFIVKFKV